MRGTDGTGAGTEVAGRSAIIAALEREETIVIGTTSSTGSWLPRALGTLAVLLTLLAPLGTARAVQDDDNGLVEQTRYDSPQFGYSIQWDHGSRADEPQSASAARGDRRTPTNEAVAATISVLGYGSRIGGRASLAT